MEMTNATAGGEEPETLEEAGTEGAVPKTDADVEATGEAGAEVEGEAHRQAQAGRRVPRPSALAGRLGASQGDRLFGSSGALARMLRPTDQFRLLYRSPGQDMARRFTTRWSERFMAASGITGWSERFMVASGITGWSERFMVASGITERHRRLFAQLTEGVVRPEVWKPLVPPPEYFRYLTGIAERFKAAIFIFIPANLQPFSATNWTRILELGREEGIALAWVPRMALVQALLDAPDAAAREQLLFQEETAVLDDCAACLDTITEDSAMVELAGFARQAIDICRRGGHAGAQALATNVVETIAKHHLDRVVMGKGKGVSNRIRNRFGVPIDDSIALDELRVWLVGAPLFAAYREDYDYATRDSAFNRHGTAHCVNPNVYRPANALLSILLATSLLRLMDEELAEAEQVA
jgi:hypothetical protein